MKARAAAASLIHLGCMKQVRRIVQPWTVFITAGALVFFSLAAKIFLPKRKPAS